MLNLDDMAKTPKSETLSLDEMMAAPKQNAMSLDDMAETPVEEASAWEQFRYAFDKAGNITSYAANILERYIPLGRVTFDLNDGFQYISPNEAYGEDFIKADPEQRREMIFEAKQRNLEEKYGPNFEAEGVPAFVGEMAKGLLDPTTLVPVGQSYKAIAGISAGLGASYSALQDEAETGFIDPQKALITGAASGLIAPATVAGARVLGNKMATSRYRKKFKEAQDVINQKVAQGHDVTDVAKTLKDAGLDPVDMARAQAHLGTKLRVPASADRAQEAIRQAVTVDSASSRLYSKGLDKFLGALSSRVRNISEPVFGRLRRYEFNIHKQTQDAGKKVEPFLLKFNKINRGSRDAIARHLYNGEFDAAEGMMRSVDPRLADDFAVVKNELQSKADALFDAGHSFEKLDNYFPRIVKDVDGLLESLGTQRKSRIQKALSDFAKVKKIPVSQITSEDKAEIIDLVLRGYRMGTDAGKPRFLKPRQIEKLTPEQLKFYASPDESLHRYLRGAVNDIEKRKFFGRSGVETAGKFDPQASIGRYIADEVDAGNINADKQDELAELLTARFVSGDVPTSKFVGTVRSLGYMGTIANPISAITQLGDIGITSALKGMRNSVNSLFGTKNAKLIDIGLDQVISEEFSDAGLAAKALNKTLTLGGFRAVDRLGKETFINASLKQAQNRAKTAAGVAKLRQKWGRVFGDEFESLVADLQNKQMSDNVKFMLFNEIADVQPVSLSEMPQSYLENPNWRIVYMLKSFTLKQYDLARNQIIRQWKQGNKAEAVKNAVRLAGYMTAANTGTGIVKDWLQGREIPPESLPSEAMWALLGVYGVNEYTNERYLKRGDIKGAIVNQIVPATPIIDAAFKVGKFSIDEIAGEGGNAEQLEPTLRAIPVVGPLVYAWFGGGAERYNERLD